MKMPTDDLFAEELSDEPLAARMRPRTIDEFVGQEHIVGPGRLLRRAIQADQLTSVIFYGPPGTGKTTLARVIANTTRSYFRSLNAVLSGVKDVRAAVAEAQESRRLYGRRTILFVDEVHRWNKAQQDALLPWVENGTVILIGATTQNPFFEVNSALVSRSRVFQLKPLSNTDLYQIAAAAVRDPERGYGRIDVRIDEDALDHLVHVADGDARSLLGAIELAVETTPDTFPPPPGQGIHVDLEIAEESIQRKAVLYDKEGDYHFDIISAFIKSIRGSDPDAALYWMARMVRAGEDPHYVFRRMLISASEDVGLADPAAIGYVESAARAFDRVGMPEGQFHLAQAALYLATAKKSNTTLGFFDAATVVEEEQSADVPSHLRDANRDKEGFGHGEGYLYPHAYRDHWVVQAYLPKPLQGRVFYKPSDQGYEAKIREDVYRRRELQLAAMVREEPHEILTFSPGDKRRDQWIRRAESGRTEVLSEVRRELFDRAPLERHAVVLTVERGPGLLMWEAFRKTPEGKVVGLIDSEESLRIVEHYARELPDIDRPDLEAGTIDTFENTKGYAYEAVIGHNTATRHPDKEVLFRRVYDLLAPGGTCVFAEVVPSRGMRLSQLVDDDDALLSKVRGAEEALYNDRDSPLLSWDGRDLALAAETAGLSDIRLSERELYEERTIRREHLDAWLAGSAPGSYGAALRSVLNEEERSAVARIFAGLAGRSVEWRTVTAFLSARRPPRVGNAGKTG